MTRVTLTVNGEVATADLEPRTQLAEFLRDHCLLTGTHLGCEHGVCGACTVLLDGEPARSCIAFAVACDGADVRTIEGLDDDPVTQRLRAAFKADHALQCGYCTPGMLVTARDIVLRLPDADDDRIRLELAGNLCRCTGYSGIVRAIRRVLGDPVERPRPAPHVRTVVPSRDQPVLVAAAPAGMAAGGPSVSLTVCIARPRAEIWLALHDPYLLAACVPGARVDSIQDGRIEGEVRVALGPISATFAGAGNLVFDETTQQATLSGDGQDRLSRTSLSGRATVVLEEIAADETKVSLTLTYSLRGPLAQLARGPVVRSLVARMSLDVARALERRLAGVVAASEVRPLSAVGVLRLILWQRLRRWFGIRRGS